jgi:hypothetical protein
VKYHRSKQEDAYAVGLRTAFTKGVSAGMDSFCGLDDNPYRRYEHRKSWDEGFKSAFEIGERDDG